jgi:hypothetical protein
VSIERSHVPARHFAAHPYMAMTAEDAAEPIVLRELARLGINMPGSIVRDMLREVDWEAGEGRDSADDYALDDQQGLLSVASITTPIQFLQNWLPGFVKFITAARKIDEIIGITTSGSWEDEEIVQGLIEYVGNAVPYGDYTNVPFASWNTNFVRRTVLRFEKGLMVAMLEEARAGRIRINSGAEKRRLCAETLEVQRNKIGFYGYNAGVGRTYGFLNDPGLPAYVNFANGASNSSLWSTKTAIEITADLRAMAAQLQIQSQDNIDPEGTECTLVISMAVYQYLSVVFVYGNTSVRQWIRETYPKWRIVSAPQLTGANGGLNVAYLFADSVNDAASDDSRTWVQIVPSKFQALGVEKRAKSYIEDYANATAGALLKRPYAVVRYTGN